MDIIAVHISELSVHCRVMRVEESEGRRLAREPRGQLTLLHACKPHTKAVTSLALDREGKTLATGVGTNAVCTRIGHIHSLHV